MIINGINQFETSNPNDTLSKCKWYHIAGVKEGQQARLYVNGILTAERTLPVGTIRVSNGPANLGTNYPTGYNNWFDGNIDEFRLWNFARTQGQIQSTMNDSLLGNEVGLQAYYKFNESGQGNGITLANSAQVSGSQMNGTTVSPNSSFPRLVNSEILPFPPPPVVPTQASLCFPGGIFNLNVTPPSGVNVYQYKWFNPVLPDTLLIPGVNGNAYTTPALNSTDTFFVSLVDRNKCESIKVPVIATVRPIPVVQLSQSLVSFCDSATITFSANVIGNEVGNYSWWRGYAGTQLINLQPTGNNLVLTNHKKSDTIWVSFTSQFNCTCQKEFKIISKRPKPFPPVINSPIHICKGESASFSISGTGNQVIRLYSDSTLLQLIGEGTFNQVIQTPFLESNKSFWATLSDADDICKSIGKKIQVVVHPYPVISLTPSISSFCDSANIIFTSQLNTPEIGTYTWWRGYSGNQLLNPQPSGSSINLPNLKKSDTIWVSFTSQFNCPGNKTFASVKKMPGTSNLTIQFEDSICPGTRAFFHTPDFSPGLAKLYSDEALSELVGTGSIADSLFSPILNSDSRFWIKIPGTDSTCESSKGPFSIKMKDCSKPLFFPNLITANRDGKNDAFEIKNLEFYQAASLVIYNRWGKKIFESNDYKNDWTSDLTGIYFYQFELGNLKVNNWISVNRE